MVLNRAKHQICCLFFFEAFLNTILTLSFIFSGNFCHKRKRCFFASSSCQRKIFITNDRSHDGNLSLDIVNLH